MDKHVNWLILTGLSPGLTLAAREGRAAPVEHQKWAGNGQQGDNQDK